MASSENLIKLAKKVESRSDHMKLAINIIKDLVNDFASNPSQQDIDRIESAVEGLHQNYSAYLGEIQKALCAVVDGSSIEVIETENGYEL